MNFPSLPLTFDASLAPRGALFFDNSTLEKIRCPRLLEYSWLRRRELVANKAGRNFGSTLHAGWATRYRLCGANSVKPDDEAMINQAMETWLAENPQPTDDFRNYNHACTVMRAYNSIYGNETFRILINPRTSAPLVECSFALPFFKVREMNVGHLVIPWDGTYDHVHEDDIVGFYTGKIDTGIEDNNGIWSFDHKTTFQFGETFDAQMLRDGGQMGYFWALWQVLGKRPQGYIINSIRIRKPKRMDEYSGSAPVDGTDFKRMPFAIPTDDVVEAWKKDTLAHIQTIINFHDTQHFPEARWNCTNKFGKCDFFEACVVPVAQREQILMNSTMFEESNWSPLNPASKSKNQESKEK